MTIEDLVGESLTRGAIGDASRARPAIMGRRPGRGLRNVDGVEAALLSMFKPGKKTWREVGDALKNGDLTRASHRLALGLIFSAPNSLRLGLVLL